MAWLWSVYNIVSILYYYYCYYLLIIIFSISCSDFGCCFSHIDIHLSHVHTEEYSKKNEERERKRERVRSIDWTPARHSDRVWRRIWRWKERRNNKVEVVRNTLCCDCMLLLYFIFLLFLFFSFSYSPRKQCHI